MRGFLTRSPLITALNCKRTAPSLYPVGASVKWSCAIPCSLKGTPALFFSHGKSRLLPSPNGSDGAYSDPRNSEKLGKSEEEALRNVFYDIRFKLRSRLPIGSAFRLLSKESQATLAKHRIPFETFLLHFQDHLVVFRTKAASHNGTIEVCLAYQLPQFARRCMLRKEGVHPLLMKIASEEGMLKGGSVGVETDDNPNLSKKQKLEYILSNIPDEFVSFVELKIPPRVKEEFMGYPTVKPKNFFLAHPKLFEVQDADGPHTFYVRRRVRSL